MKKTPFNQIHKDLGAKMVEYAGFEMPVQYTGVKEEHMAVRENVGVFDVSHMGQFKITGKDAEQFIQKLITNDLSKIKIGQAQYACFTNENGGIKDDLISYKFGEEEFMLVVNAGTMDKDWEWVNKNKDQENVSIENISEEIALIAVQGPNSAKALQSLTEIDLASIPFYHFVTGNFAGVENVIISATGYTGAGGFELYIPADKGEQVWNAIFNTEFEPKILPCGLASRDTLRLEKGYCLYGNDIDETKTPLEAGLGWVTKLKKSFIGSKTLKKQKEEGVKQKLIGFKIIGKGIPRHGYEIINSQKETIGEVTSGTQSPILNEGIGLGYVKTEYSKPGTKIYLKIRNKEIEAEVTKIPFVN